MINRNQKPHTNRVLTCFAVLILLFCSCTQEPEGPETGYGRSFGSDYATSVNGTKVLKSLLSEMGFQNIDRYRKFSPRLERYQTVVWMPDAQQAPSEASIDFAEQWLENGWNRTLIYVGRDYDAEAQYWQTLADSTTDPTTKVTYLRRKARAIASFESTKRSYLGSEAMECKWFEVKEGDRRPVTKLKGDLARSIDVTKTDMHLSRTLKPTPSDDYVFEVLLKANGKPFIYTFKRNSWNEGKIVFVNNPSFLLNLPLVNHEHRELAQSFLDETIEHDPILFVEHSGYTQISNSEFENPNRWSWVAKKPLRYIVPHLIFWTVLFCFVYFPIFGRPKHTKKKATTNFRDHIKALGSLLERTDSRQTAKSWIEECRNQTSNKRSKN